MTSFFWSAAGNPQGLLSQVCKVLVGLHVSHQEPVEAVEDQEGHREDNPAVNMANISWIMQTEAEL